MTGDGPTIVIEGPREDWPGGARTRATPAENRMGRAILAWMPPDHPLDPDLNRFQVSVSDDGDTRESNATATDSLAPTGPDDRLRLKQRTR